MLAGPATNAASFTVLMKILGKRTAIIYIISIAVCAVIFGMILNGLYNFLGIDIHAAVGHAHEMIPAWLKWTTAIPLLIALVIASLRKE